MAPRPNSFVGIPRGRGRGGGRGRGRGRRHGSAVRRSVCAPPTTSIQTLLNRRSLSYYNI
eukprot:3672480-Heterocapsa_arctica.AAC.1